MEPRTYKIIELVGVSDVSYDDAAKRAIERASKTLKGLGWFKVTELRLDPGRRSGGIPGNATSRLPFAPG